MKIGGSIIMIIYIIFVIMYMNTILCWGFLIAFMILYGINAMIKKEGYSNIMAMDYFIPTYQACRAQGYSKEFCVQSPSDPGSCICGDGRRGKYLVGYRGECVCDDHNAYQLSY
jgi:hypothetical protein